MKQCIKNADKALFGAGWALLSIGFVTRVLDYRQDILGFATGLGCGFVLIGVLSMFIRMRNPKYAKQQEIEQADERNIMIRGKAGYISFFVTVFVLTALVLAFLVMDYGIGLLLAIAALAAHALSFFVAMFIYGKKL